MLKAEVEILFGSQKLVLWLNLPACVENFDDKISIF